MRYSLNFTKEVHSELLRHLYPGDGKEAAAIMLCGQRPGKKTHRLSVREIYKIPYDECTLRTEVNVAWPTKLIIPLLEKSEEQGLTVFKVHSHPNGFDQFSSQDDASDRDLFPSLYALFGDERLHGSAIMLPDGKIKARICDPSNNFHPIDSIFVIGDDIEIWPHDELAEITDPEFALRNIQAFGAGTYRKLECLTACVVGTSGTGSVMIENLVRLGIGRLLIIDCDLVERKNLNRILNTKSCHIGEYKVDVLKRVIDEMGLNVEVEVVRGDIWDKEVALRVAECDIVFGCVDSPATRMLINRITAIYSQPYFDVGVRLEADKQGGIDQICGSVHYLQPGKSSLTTRKAISEEAVRAEMLKKFNPQDFEALVKQGYIKNVVVENPAVLPVNMHFSSLTIMEFLARIHGFRQDSNAGFAQITISLTGNFRLDKPEGPDDLGLKKLAGRGDMRLFLNMPHMSETLVREDIS